MAGEKQTDGIRFDWEDGFHAQLERIAQAKGYHSHNALARDVLKDYIRRELHAAKVILGMSDDVGISRSEPEFSGARRK